MLQCSSLPFRWIRCFSHVAVYSTPLCSEAVTNLTKNNSVVEPKAKLKLEEPVLDKIKKERDPEKLFELFKKNANNRVLIENKYRFEDTVSRLVGAGKYEYVEYLLEQQKALPQGRREGFIVRIIMLYGMAGMTKQALQTFYDMHLFGCKRTVKSFNAALKVLMQTRDLAAIDFFLKVVPLKFEIQLDIISANIIISAFCGMDILDKAYLLMLEMKAAGIEPDVVTYTTLISACYKKGQWVIANGLWNLMVRKVCYPNVATFNARIQFLVSHARAWEANSLMGLMECLGMQPDGVTYNLVIKGFCQAGYLEMAKRVYTSLHGRGYKPNVKIYQTMVHYLSEGGEFDWAYTLCKDCMKKNLFLNVDTIHKLLEGLKKRGKVEKARMILMLAEKKCPPYPVNTLDSIKFI